MYLFQPIAHLAGDVSQFLHIGFGTSGMTGDEIGDELLSKPVFLTDAVEEPFEFIELPERRLAHKVQHTVAGMLWCHLQSSADMTGNQFAGIFLCRSVGGIVFALIQQQVVAHTTADKAFLDARQCIHGTVDFQEARVVGVKIRAYLRMDATGAFAFFAGVDVAPVHPVHVCRWSSQVGEIAFEVVHLHHLSHFLQDTFL